MKRIHLFLLFIIVSFTSTYSDNRYYKFDSNSVVKASSFFGMKVAWLVNTPTNAKAYGNKLECLDWSMGVEIGSIYHKPITRNLFFEPGINFYCSELHPKSDFYNRYMERGYMSLYGISMPLNFGYANRTNRGQIFIMSGPVFDYGLYGHEKAKFLKGWGEEVNQDCFKSLNRFNIFWNIGIGLTERRFTWGFDWTIGLTDFVKVYNINSRHSIWKFYIRYNF